MIHHTQDRLSPAAIKQIVIEHYEARDIDRERITVIFDHEDHLIVSIRKESAE